MSTDVLYRGILPGPDLKWVACVTPGVIAEAVKRHELEAGSAQLLGEAVNAAALLAALQKGETRINLQVECDGPLKGLFIDASAAGALRGYVKQRELYATAAVMGRSGFLSVLRDNGDGQHYRSSVELQAMELAPDLERYFTASDQIPTRVALAATGGVLVQCLPGSDPEAMLKLTKGLGDRLVSALKAGAPVAKTLFGAEPFEVLASYPLEWKCSCSKERVKRALVTMGAEELKDMIENDKKASAQCQFCGQRYELGLDELKALLN